MQESRAVREECTAWTTTKHKKTQETVSDANARPVVLPGATVVTVSGVLLDVQPRSLLVQTPEGLNLEIREAFLRPL